MHLLQTAVGTDSYSTYQRFSRGVQALPPVYLRDLLEFNTAAKPVPLEEVEPVTALRRRFVTPGMSLGALSPEAHETLAIAMNRIGAKAVSGEGGEATERFTPRPNGDNANSAVKQIASGRFGVTVDYLLSAREIEIKVAQGAKPGEGGQLPGFKVTEFIAHLRHSTPGVTLISPPPHHDIYSIEDLAQLIYDLKQVNPTARVCVKLVSCAGIGTVAAGVAKAHADAILVSGHTGGTGASPQTSIKYAGTPWEMGLAEVHQVLSLNGLRERVTLRTDGGLKTGRDVVIAAILGAEEYGIGTLSLVAMGCIMVRQCHSNTCPVGVCTQDERLRAKFTGTPDKVINLMTFIAEEAREVLASLGARSLEEVIGRTELLRQVSRGAEHLDDLDLNPVLAKVDDGSERRFAAATFRNQVPDSLDAQMIADAGPALERGEKMQLAYTVRNTHRAVGTRLSSELVRRFGSDGLAAGHVTVRLRGSAGQSLGAFLARAVDFGGVRRRQRLCRQGLVGRHGGGAPAGVVLPGDAGQHDRRQHRALRRHIGRALRRRPGGRAVRGQELRRGGGGRGLRSQWLRVHDRRHSAGPGAGRPQFRRGDDGRHGLRDGRWLRRGGEPRLHRLAADQDRSLGRPRLPSARRARPADGEPLGGGVAGRLGRHPRPAVAGGAPRDAGAAGRAAERRGTAGCGVGCRAHLLDPERGCHVLHHTHHPAAP